MSIDVSCVVNYLVIRLTIPVVEHLNGENFMDNSGDISCTGIFIEICPYVFITGDCIETICMLKVLLSVSLLVMLSCVMSRILVSFRSVLGFVCIWST